MTEIMKSGSPADTQAAEVSGTARAARRPRREEILWRIVFAVVLALITGTFVILWPAFKAAGAAIGVGMAVALLVLSLTPVLLLRGVLRRAPGAEAAQKDEL